MTTLATDLGPVEREVLDILEMGEFAFGATPGWLGFLLREGGSNYSDGLILRVCSNLADEDILEEVWEAPEGKPSGCGHEVVVYRKK